jgi:membrane-bound lytic murein transglycosylase D
MHSRNLLPLLVLFAAGCAQVPSDPAESALQPPVANRAAAPVPVAVAPAPVMPTPKLQVAEQIPAPAAPVAAAEVPSKSLWPRITRGFAMQPMDNDLVREWENWYASRPDYVARMIGRSSRLLFHIVEQVEKRGMPMEVALLPMIESAYNPVAYSRAHASGIWQFIPSTGKDYGLRQNWWYDGRRDVLRATDAALDYLERLHGMFGDWQLALASYNWGEGAVGRAMEKNRQKGLATDYESLTVPGETRNYIPKLIAVKNIISNPAKYGLTIADIPNEPYFDTVTVKRHIDMKLAAKLAEMPVDEFKFLNPGHNKPVIKAGEAERIVLPIHKVEVFRSNFAKHDKPMVTWQAVTFKRGEKAERVAAEHGMTLSELKEVNGLQNQKKLVVGQPLLVPLKEGAAEPQFPDLPATPVSLPKAIQAAQAKQQHVQVARGGKQVVVKRGVAPKTAAKTVVVKAPAPKGRTLQAERGKQIKVVAPAKPAVRKAQTKVASR